MAFNISKLSLLRRLMSGSVNVKLVSNHRHEDLIDFNEQTTILG